MGKKRFNIIDVGIVLFVLLVGFLAVNRTGTSVQSFTFDGQDLSRATRKYMELDQGGSVVKARVIGFDSRTGDSITQEGIVTWASLSMFVMKQDGRTFSVGGPAARLEDINATIVVLETVGEIETGTVTAQPKQITKLEQLIPEGVGENFKIYTQVALAETNPLKLQAVTNALRAQQRYVPVYPLSVRNTINIEGAGLEDIRIASEILGELEGLSDIINVRVYGGER